MTHNESTHECFWCDKLFTASEAAYAGVEEGAQTTYCSVDCMRISEQTLAACAAPELDAAEIAAKQSVAATEILKKFGFTPKISAAGRRNRVAHNVRAR